MRNPSARRLALALLLLALIASFTLGPNPTNSLASSHREAPLSTAGFNVSTIAIEVPIQEFTRTGDLPAGPTAPDAVIGVWATSSRQKITVLRSNPREGEEDR